MVGTVSNSKTTRKHYKLPITPSIQDGLNQRDPALFGAVYQSFGKLAEDAISMTIYIDCTDTEHSKIPVQYLVQDLMQE